MSVSDYFSETYAQARSQFLSEARAINARLTAREHPDVRSPDGEVLAADVAMIGPEEPESVLCLLSGTHGVEGFCGSGCQVGFLRDRLYEALPKSTQTLLIHAINPYGFAWLRRVTEDNVDLNRNFCDFTQSPPNKSYETLHDWLVPADWDGPARKAADAALFDYMKQHGMREFQAAVSSGQYTRPKGLFYGGLKETWSARTIRDIVGSLPNRIKKLAVIEFHSGLGPYAYGEPIHMGGGADLQRARAWYGPEVTNLSANESSSAFVHGTLASAFQAKAGECEVTYIALEFGTEPVLEVLKALRADHWLHAVGGMSSPHYREIKRQIRDAFYVDTPAWKAAVYGRAADLIVRAARNLA